MNDNNLVASLKYQINAYKDKLINSQKRIDELENICARQQVVLHNNSNNNNNNSNNKTINIHPYIAFIKAIELLTKVHDNEDININDYIKQFRSLQTREMRAILHTLILNHLHIPLEYNIPKPIAESNTEWNNMIDYEILELIHNGTRSKVDRFRYVDFAIVFRIVHEHKIYELWVEINPEPVDNHGRSYDMECIIPRCITHHNIIRVCHSYRGNTESLLSHIKLPALRYRIPHRSRFTVFDEVDQSLLQFFDHTRFVPENVLLLLCLQITRAISRLEENFITHRDICASTIFISTGAEIRLANMSACLELATQQPNGEWLPIIITDRELLKPVSSQTPPSQLARALEQFKSARTNERPTLDEVYYGYDIWCLGRMISLLLNYGTDENVQFNRRQSIPKRFSPYLKSLISLMLLSDPKSRPSAKDCCLFLSVALFGPAVEKYGSMSSEQAQDWIFEQRVKMYYKKKQSYEQLPIEDLLKREYLSTVTPTSLSNVMHFYFEILEATT